MMWFAFGYRKWCTFYFGIILLLLLLLILMLRISNDYHSILSAQDTTFNKKHNNDKEQLQESLSSFSFPSIDFFDCHRNNSSCTYFQPRHFFQNGSGNAFFMNGDFERLGGSNLNLPACTGLSWWSSSSSATTPWTIPYFNNNNNYWHNLSFVHIHKCGGTTIHAIMRALQKQIIMKSSSSSSLSSSWNNATCTVETYKYSIGGGSKYQKQVNNQKRLAYIQAIARAQQQQQQHDTLTTDLLTSSSSSLSLPTFFPVFTIVRDPVDRFLSAFQQVMHYNDELRSKCLKCTAKSTIQCVIQYVGQKTKTNSGGLLDVHLVPMAMHLRLFHETNIVISVFHLKDINAISQYLNLESSMMMSHDHNSNSIVGSTATTSAAPVIHIHDRSQVKFATSKVLATMSVKDCDSKMLYDICDLYAVDVAMMHTLGFETPYCSLSSSS